VVPTARIFCFHLLQLGGGATEERLNAYRNSLRPEGSPVRIN